MPTQTKSQIIIPQAGKQDKQRQVVIKKYVLYIILLLILVTVGILSGYLLKRQSGIRNVILISIDTCRADHLGCYGFDGPITPRIDEIAGEGILFKKAHTPVPLTLPAHCSLLTGTYPPYHGVHDNFEYKLGASSLTLAEILKKQGLATGAVISSIVLDQKFGTDQGFDIYHDQFEEPAEVGEFIERRAEETSRWACDYLAEHQNQPFFLFLHYYDPHHHYNPPEPFASRYADDFYAGEIAYTDHCIGEVIDQLKKLDLYDSSLIIITGDHGESLGEHGEALHGYYIYQSTIHVPLIIRAPGRRQPQEIEETVSLVDVMPTILGCLDLPIPAHVQGHDLSDYSRGQASSEQSRYVYTESIIPTQFGCNPLLGLVSSQWNYINTSRPELYDLHADRRELHNLANQEAQQVRLLNHKLQEMAAQMVGAELIDSRLELDAESRRRLESLGYVRIGAMDDSLEFDPSKKDAKDMILCNEHQEKTVILTDEKKYDQAQALCNQMMAQWPKALGGYSLSMRIAYETNKPAEVIEQGLRYLALYEETMPAPSQANQAFQFDELSRTYSLIALSALKLEKYDLVIEYCRKFLQIKPNSPASPMVRNTLARAHSRQGQQDQAFEMWVKLLGQNPNSAEIYKSMGIAYYEAGELEQAEVHLSRALQLKPNLTEARRHLNNIVGMKQLNQSIAQYLERLRRQPDDPATHGKLAYAFFQKGDYDMAIEHWRESIRIKPDWPEPYHNLAGLLVTTKDQKLRNSAEAVRLAERAAELSQYKNAAILQTLSLAYAATDNYAEAISTAQKALKIATSEGDKALAEKLSQYVNRYRSKLDIQEKNRALRSRLFR